MISSEHVKKMDLLEIPDDWNESNLSLLLQSDTCAVLVPELELELVEGTLGGRFTTIEGLLTEVKEQVCVVRCAYCLLFEIFTLLRFHILIIFVILMILILTFYTNSDITRVIQAHNQRCRIHVNFCNSTWSLALKEFHQWRHCYVTTSGWWAYVHQPPTHLSRVLNNLPLQRLLGTVRAHLFQQPCY
jgi:ZPR1 zinc-finger domain